MGCEETKELLALFAGGEIEAQDRDSVEVHVAGCASCARELDSYRETRTRLSALGEPSDSTDVPDVWSGVQAELFPWRQPSSWKSGKRGPVLIRYAAVFIVGMAIGLVANAFLRTLNDSADSSFSTTAVAAPQDPISAEVRPVHGGASEFRFELPSNFSSDHRDR